MAALAHSVKFTYEDYLLFPDDGRRHELIAGDRYVTPAPSRKHQIVVGNLHLLLQAHVKQERMGRVYLSPFDVVLSEEDVVQPDLLYVSREHAEHETDKGLSGAPDLVIEVLSEGSRRNDEVVKRKLYERVGVREYWIVDPVLETVKVFRSSPQGYQRVAELSAEAADCLGSPLFPGWSAALAAIFDLS